MTPLAFTPTLTLHPCRRLLLLARSPQILHRSPQIWWRSLQSLEQRPTRKVDSPRLASSSTAPSLPPSMASPLTAPRMLSPSHDVPLMMPSPLLDFWPSMFGIRVRIALAKKRVEQEYWEENLLATKSPALVCLNPVHKKIPILVHDARLVCESLIVAQYIDEPWAGPGMPTFLPSYPYAHARSYFWSDFVEKKMSDIGSRLWKMKGTAVGRAG